ncbi:MAG: hypothetical protein AAFN92_04870 [Bacteroidota bacterium]
MRLELSFDWRLVLFFLAFYGLLFAGAPGVNLVMLLLILNALRSVEGSLQSLFLLSLVLIGNGKLIYKYSLMIVLGRWVVLILASLNIFFRTRSFAPLTLWFLALMAVVMGNSIAFGQLPGVSVFKALVFTLGVFGLLTGFRCADNLEGFGNFLFNGFLVVVGLSALVGVLAPGISWLVSEHTDFSGLTGVVNHPQPFAVYLSMTLVLVLGNLFDNERVYRLAIPLFAALLGLVLMYLTKARVAFVVVGSVVGLSTLLAFFKHSYASRYRFIFSHAFPYLVGGALMLTLYLNPRGIQEQITDFVYKNGRNGYDLVESFQGSRGFLILQQVANIERHPLTGIGFGVPSRLEGLEIGKDPLFGIPIQAQVEKGTIFLAIIEENGFLIGGLVFGFIITLVVLGARSTKLMIFGTILAGILVNLGEAIFFSLGGSGLYAWLLMTFCLGLAAREEGGAAAGAGLGTIRPT